MNEDFFKNLYRINVVGTSGSGKSTLARQLAYRLNYPYIEMDNLYWKENWQHYTDEEFFAKLQWQLNGKCWVLDGNYTKTTAIKWKSVQMVIWLDFPFYITLYRALRRALLRLITQQPLWHGNKESFKKLFSKDSIVLWTINTYKANILKYEGLMRDARFAHINFIRIKSNKQLKALLNSAHV